MKNCYENLPCGLRNNHEEKRRRIPLNGYRVGHRPRLMDEVGSSRCWGRRVNVHILHMAYGQINQRPFFIVKSTSIPSLLADFRQLQLNIPTHFLHTHTPPPTSHPTPLLHILRYTTHSRTHPYGSLTHSPGTPILNIRASSAPLLHLNILNKQTLLFPTIRIN